MSYGCVDDGVSFPPELSTNQNVFLVLWTGATLLLCFVCIYGYTQQASRISQFFALSLFTSPIGTHHQEWFKHPV